MKKIVGWDGREEQNMAGVDVSRLLYTWTITEMPLRFRYISVIPRNGKRISRLNYIILCSFVQG